MKSHHSRKPTRSTERSTHHNLQSKPFARVTERPAHHDLQSKPFVSSTECQTPCKHDLQRKPTTVCPTERSTPCTHDLQSKPVVRFTRRSTPVRYTEPPKLVRNMERSIPDRSGKQHIYGSDENNIDGSNETNIYRHNENKIYQDDNLALITRNARSLFRKDVWLQVATIMTCLPYQFKSESNACGQLNQTQDHPCITKRSDAFDALRATNYNVVERARTAAASVSIPDTIRLYPVCIVMIHINMAYSSHSAVKGVPRDHSLEGVPAHESDTSWSIPRVDWSDDAITDIIENSTMYGKINPRTRVVVQIRFTGLLCHGLDTDTTTNGTTYTDGTATGTANVGSMKRATSDEAIAVVVSDQVGMAYSYNLPGNTIGSIASRCVSRLLWSSTGHQPSMIIHAVKYQPRCSYDGCLYALYITAGCAEEGIGRCECLRVDRPTRVIANLRFLMLLKGNKGAGIAAGLLLDECNTLDSFRRVTSTTTRVFY